MPTHRHRHVDWTPERIRRERTKARLTQQQLANLLNVSASAISQWENGTHQPHAGHRAELVRILIDGEAVAPIDKRVSLLESQLREVRKDLRHLQEMVALLAQR